jgi:hypothetical protein
LFGDPEDFKALKTSPERFSGNIVVLVCVTYRSQAGKIHQTAEAYELFRPNAKINPEGDTVPAGQIGLTASPMGGAFAN